MFDEDSISLIRGSCDDCDWGRGEAVGGWLMKIATKKNQTNGFDFFGAIPIEGSVMIVMGRRRGCVSNWLTKIATKKIEPTFSIFSAVIFVT